MSTPLLSLHNVSRHFGGLIAVDDVSFDLHEGELAGLIGPNGAGKTTLFNLITGFSKLSSGSIEWNGEAINQHSAADIARLGIARTFQNLRVFPNLTVFDNVSVGAVGHQKYGLFDALFQRKQASQNVTAATWKALELTGLTPYANQLAANLSYGKRQYLEIARALAFSPKLLILDEPAAGLNDTETAELARFLQKLNQHGTTLLLVEHDLNLVMSLCRRVLVLASGQLIADGSPRQIARNKTVQDVYLGSDEVAA